MFISTSEDDIIFKLKNTKPQSHIEHSVSDKSTIGMSNTVKQLELLYPNAHNIEVHDTKLTYTLELKIKQHEQV